jgi:hypothetical protein
MVKGAPRYFYSSRKNDNRRSALGGKAMKRHEYFGSTSSSFAGHMLVSYRSAMEALDNNNFGRGSQAINRLEKSGLTGGRKNVSKASLLEGSTTHKHYWYKSGPTTHRPSLFCLFLLTRKGTNHSLVYVAHGIAALPWWYQTTVRRSTMPLSLLPTADCVRGLDGPHRRPCTIATGPRSLHKHGVTFRAAADWRPSLPVFPLRQHVVSHDWKPEWGFRLVRYSTTSIIKRCDSLAGHTLFDPVTRIDNHRLRRY